MAKKKTTKRAPARKKAPKRKRPSKAKTPTDVKGGLTPQQARFVDEYLISLNATEAAILSGYSEHSANSMGSQLRSNPKVASAIAEAQSLRSARTRITADNVLREWALLGFSSADVYEIDDDGNVQPKEGVNPAVMRAIQRVKRRVTYTKKGDRVVETEFALWSKDGGLRALSDHLGICTKKNEVDVKHSLYDLIVGAEDLEKEDGEEG